MCGRKSHFSWEQNSLFEIIVIQNKISSVCLLISCRDGWEGGEPFLKCKWCISIRVECNYMSCIQVTTLQFYWSHRICRIVVELVLWQVINDLPVWQFANAHKGMRKNAGSENLSFCQNSTAIFRGRSPSFSELRQREVRHFLRGVQYWPYAHKVMWKVPHLSSGKRQSLSPVSTTSSLLPSFTTHWTKIGFWRLISLTWNFTE